MAYDDEAMALPIRMHNRVSRSRESVAENRLTASESLEHGLLDDTVVIDLDLQLHHIATCRGTDETGSDVEVLLVE